MYCTIPKGILFNGISVPDPSGLGSPTTLLKLKMVLVLPRSWRVFMLFRDKCGKLRTFVSMPIFSAVTWKHSFSTKILSPALDNSNHDQINLVTCVVTHSNRRKLLANASLMSVSNVGSFERSCQASSINSFSWDGVICPIFSIRDWLISSVAGGFAAALVLLSSK